MPVSANGDVEAAGTAADRLSDVVGGGAHSQQLAALAASARGRVLIAQGATEAAAAELHSAVATLSRLELPFELAHAQYDLGRALVDTSLRRRRSTTSAARSPASRTSAPPSTPIASPPSSARWACPLAPAPRVSGSSPIASNRCSGSLSAGLSNPEIAQRLHVSRKTAAHHVSHILTKLNLRNRAEVVALRDARVG